MSKVHKDIDQIQEEILKYIGGLDANSITFDFLEKDNNIVLNIVTVNPRHNQSFLFHTVTGIDKEDALSKMLKYVKSYKEQESSYTIQWSLMGKSELNTSYFRAKNIISALDKFYYARDMNSIIVFSVVLNPIA